MSQILCNLLIKEGLENICEILKFFIKNTVSLSKLMLVKDELEKIGLPVISVEIGEITTAWELTLAQYDAFWLVLHQAGIELFEDKKDILVQRIKNSILEVVYRREDPLIHNLSTHLAESLRLDYTYISNLFSEREHVTIERFYICHRIERVKALLLHDRLSLTDIAFKLHYSSLGHLSSQFKKVTGLTPSQFKQQHVQNL